MYIFMIENVDEFFLFKPPLGRDALVVIRFESNIIIGRESRATHLQPNVWRPVHIPHNTTAVANGS